MKKLTQKDLCVLYLAEHDGWYPAYKLKGVPFHKHFLGSESDTRLYEVFGKSVDKNGTLQETKWNIDGNKFRVQTMKHRGTRIYRAKQTEYKKIKKAKVIEGRAIMYEEPVQLCLT